ncbi:MAG: hypothetical protein D6813_00615 [Calditrichaeota bacterium]|nr:MAG: hypothetical protein D6813_00615 [Calditrichota bacterium]
MSRKVFLYFLALYFLNMVSLYGQAPPQGVDPQPGVYGNRDFRKWGQMNGNLVNTPFINYGMAGNWPSNPDPAEWPKGSGHTYVEGATPIVVTEVIDEDGNVVHIAEVGYRELIDSGPDGTPWGYEPRPGWDGKNFERGPFPFGSNITPAMSNNPASWPDVWPDRFGPQYQDDPGWPGSWNGFFGKNQFNADLETIFVMDDAPDKEFKYHPDPSDPNRGGLGTMVLVRGLQWSQVLAEDVVFWLYKITNISAFDLGMAAPTEEPKVYFGALYDYGIGGIGDSADDSAFFDTFIDITYGFDQDNTGNTGFSPTAYAGFAFLESPGNPFNNKDDDEDGFVDDSRQTGPGEKIEGLDNILAYINSHYNVENLEKFFGLKVTEFPAVKAGVIWTGDEDLDWVPFDDFNGNGIWDPDTEPLNSDVGADGISNLDPNYTGPDFGEGDGKPTPGEPNFDATDVDESDQLGLTGVHIFVTGQLGPKDDEDIWNSFRNHLFITNIQNSQASLFYSSGGFPLPKGTNQSFSIAMVFGENLEDLFRNKLTVQGIFNANYNFAKPPLKPIVHAVPGDGKVTLYWDRRAEDSVDLFLTDPETGRPGVKDFEGYKIYRSTEPSFLESKIITDAFGNPTFRKALATFDLIDGIKGPSPVTINGVSYDLGTDSGLQHTFVDTTVENGQTYYYAVVAFDRGAPDLGSGGLPPSETTTIIETDPFGNVTSTDVNTVVVTPNPKVPGYVPPSIDENSIKPVGKVVGTGKIAAINIIDERLVGDRTYKIVFDSSDELVPPDISNQTPARIFLTTSYSVFDITNKEQLKVSRSKALGLGEEGPIFDGLSLVIENDQTELDLENSGWISGDSDYFFEIRLSGANFDRQILYPADYEIRFADGPVDTATNRRPANFTIWNVTENRKAFFRFQGRGEWKKNNFIDIQEKINGRLENIWRVTLRAPDSGGKPPEPGDVYLIATKKPFRKGDTFQFSTHKASINKQVAKSSLDRIAVVPNPYIVTASWERKNLRGSGRGERKLYFIHLPKKATIRIYNIAGDLIDVIEHDSTQDDDFAGFEGAHPWDLRTKEGLDISFGIYIYHVEAPGLGEKVGRFAIIK